MAKKHKPMQIGDITVEALPGGKLRLTLGQKSTEVEYKDLWGVAFLLGKEDKERQDQLVPVQKKEMMVFSRKHVIRAEKDIKAGETLNVWCEVNIPLTIVEAIAEENGAKVILQKIESPLQVTPAVAP